MSANREIGLDNGLSEEQIDAIEDICRIRHQIHSDPKAPRELFGYDDYGYWEYIDTSNLDNKIKLIILENDLPSWGWEYDFVNAPNYIDMDEVESDEDKQDIFDNGIFELSNLIEKWNNSIEYYLKDEIDKKYGTDYCPTGSSRVF